MSESGEKIEIESKCKDNEVLKVEKNIEGVFGEESDNLWEDNALMRAYDHSIALITGGNLPEPMKKKPRHGYVGLSSSSPAPTSTSTVKPEENAGQKDKMQRNTFSETSNKNENDSVQTKTNPTTQTTTNPSSSSYSWEDYYKYYFTQQQQQQQQHHQQQQHENASSDTPVPPPLPSDISQDEDLSNLVLSWYYCGYYTANYISKINNKHQKNQ